MKLKNNMNKVSIYIKRKKTFFLEESLFYYRRFGHLSDHYQYNKLSKNETKQKTKFKTVDSNNIEINA
jgi:hypothetical protein